MCVLLSNGLNQTDPELLDQYPSYFDMLASSYFCSLNRRSRHKLRVGPRHQPLSQDENNPGRSTSRARIQGRVEVDKDTQLRSDSSYSSIPVNTSTSIYQIVSSIFPSYHFFIFKTNIFMTCST